MPGVIATIPKFQFSANGVPMVNGTVDTYLAGTTTPETTWQDQAQTTANTNPIVLDSRGEALVWLDPAKSYKFVLKNSGGVVQWTVDNIGGNRSSADLANTTDLAKGISLVGGGARQVDAITAVNATGLPDGAVIIAKGRSAAGDGGGGIFRYVAGSAQATDGGTVFAPTAGGGRLFRDGWTTFGFNGPANLLWFGADPSGTSNVLTPATDAWNYCKNSGTDLYIPAGTYKITSGNNFPFGRIDGSTPTALTDYGNITIYGDGPATILRTDTIGGGDVIQCNGAKNLHFRDFKVTGTISGSAAGSNGVSVTGGYDNLTFENIYAENLPSLDKTTYIDGGKALTIQTPIAGQTLECGTLTAKIFAKGCVYGFGIEIDLLAASTKKTSVDIDVVAEDCRQAVIFSAGAASGVIPGDWQSGVRVKAIAINCMQDVALTRAHGVDVSCQSVSTKTDAARILNYAGVKWFAADTIADVIGLLCNYAHKSNVHLYGYKGSCAYKARVGANSAGSSGLTGSTWQSRIHVALSGTASTADFGEIDNGGNITSDCTLIAEGDNAGPSSGHYLPSRNNAIVVGNTTLVKDLLVHGAMKFTYTDGISSFAEVNYDDESVTFKQTLGSSASLRMVKMLDNAGATKFAIRNDGAISTAGRSTASAVSTVVSVLPVYSESNVFIGYVPVYSGFTP